MLLMCQNPTCLFDTGFCDGTLCLENEEERAAAIFFADLDYVNERAAEALAASEIRDLCC